MNELVFVVCLSLIAGLAMPAGAVFARLDRLHPEWLSSEWRHFIVAFGGGALLSAVALVLIPEGVEQLSIGWTAISFAAGGVCFCLLDIMLDRHQSPAGQMVAMLADFVPEAIALGAAFALGQDTGMLMAALIVLQNLPEGFNAFEELTESSNYRPNRIVLAFSAMALLGPMAAVTGYVWFANDLQLLAALMLFAGGGILYLVFDDIAPQAKLHHRWMPALGAVTGFLLGLIGSMISAATQ